MRVRTRLRQSTSIPLYSLTDADGHITFVNEAARELHGLAVLDIGVDQYSATYQLLTEDGMPYPPTELPLARLAALAAQQ